MWRGSGCPGSLLNLFWNLPWTPKISLLDFLYRDLMDQFESSRRLGDTSENNSVARESSCVIILKLYYIKITLELYRSFCPHVLGSWHFSIIYDSRCARAFSTTAPFRNITYEYIITTTSATKTNLYVTTSKNVSMDVQEGVSVAWWLLCWAAKDIMSSSSCNYIIFQTNVFRVGINFPTL